MLLSTIRIAPLTGNVNLAPDLMRKLMWQQVDTEPVEHILIRAGPGHFDIAVYTLTPNQTTADTTVRFLVTRTLSTAPHLRLWRII